MIWCAAKAIACKPEEQKRLIVAPATVTGKPARMAAMRATFQPCVPSGLAQPRYTSSISFAIQLRHFLERVADAMSRQIVWARQIE